jgi:hypothetical protein
MHHQIEKSDFWLKEFEEKGYVIIKKIIDKEIIKSVIKEISKIVEVHANKLILAGKIVDPHNGEPFEKRLHRLYQNNLEDAPASIYVKLHSSSFFDIYFNPKLLDIIKLFLGNEIRLYPNYLLRTKLENPKNSTIWWVFSTEKPEFDIALYEEGAISLGKNIFKGRQYE